MKEKRILMAYVDQPTQSQIETYEKNGGYQAIKKMIPQVVPQEFIQMVKQAELRGRGGAGFSTGLKWSFIPQNFLGPKYVVCNCDESEPGTFKDRLLIEKDPHQLIEGIILASYAIGANLAFIYCRGEFFTGIRKLNQAIEEAKQKGYLGKNILQASFSLEVIVHPGAGAYIAGEETALLNSLEGYRATPRLKPPFPAIAGLYGKPTVINNVETLCNVVHIALHGVEWYQKLGLPNNRGTKIFQISGQVEKPGCYEFEIGISLKEIIQAAGGILAGRKFKACYPGGSSCALLTANDLDISLDFDTLAKRKSAFGTASLIVMDETADMVQMALRLMEFYQNESCGKCTPCREGTRWVVQILQRIIKGQGTIEDLPRIQQICQSIAQTSFCGLGVGAAPPIYSAIAEFKEEFMQYIKRNPHHDQTPKLRIAYPYRNPNPPNLVKYV